MKELKGLETALPEEISAGPIDDDIFKCASRLHAARARAAHMSVSHLIRPAAAAAAALRPPPPATSTRHSPITCHTPHDTRQTPANHHPPHTTRATLNQSDGMYPIGQVTMTGPEGSAYEGGIFFLSVVFPSGTLRRHLRTHALNMTHARMFVYACMHAYRLPVQGT